MRLLNAISTLALVISIACIVALILLRSFFARDPVTLGLQIAGVLLMIWARRTFGVRSFHFAAQPTRGGLVTVGPYRYIRHPIYAAVMLFLWPGVVYDGSTLSLALRVLPTLATVARIQCEEHLLRREYPEYAAYAAHTKRLIPYVW